MLWQVTVIVITSETCNANVCAPSQEQLLSILDAVTAYSKHEKVEEMESLLGMSLCEQLANKR